MNGMTTIQSDNAKVWHRKFKQRKEGCKAIDYINYQLEEVISQAQLL